MPLVAVFAPSDEAFDKLPPGALEYLTSPEGQEDLTNILLFHVVSGEIRNADVFIPVIKPTLLGSGNRLTLIKDLVGNNCGVFPCRQVLNVNGDAEVTTVDIVASNGIIHVIDNVLMPEGLVLPANVVGVAQQLELDSFVTAVTDAGLLDTLAFGAGPFTVFAPSEAAFAKLPPGTLMWLALPENIEVLSSILLGHVIQGAEVLSTVLKSGPVTTLNGSVDVVVDATTGGVTVGGANVINADVDATNGVVHVVDQVLLPDGMVLPTSLLNTVAATATSATPEFTILQSAIQAAGLANVFNRDALYTVFAPTDAAFNALPAGTLQELLANPTALSNVLLYHVIDGSFTSSQIINTLRGSTSPIPTKDNGRDTVDVMVDSLGNILINNVANVVVAQSDIQASNGIIHVIDSVLIPPEKEDDDDGNDSDDKDNKKKNDKKKKLRKLQQGHLRKAKGFN